MITSGIYNYVNILDKAADAANLRNELLTNNIANVSTPNYKRKDLDFESVLQGELAGEKNLSKAVKKANQNLETLDALDAEHRLGRALAVDDLKTCLGGIKFFVEGSGAGTNTLETGHAFDALFGGEFFHGNDSFVYYS